MHLEAIEAQTRAAIAEERAAAAVELAASAAGQHARYMFGTALAAGTSAALCLLILIIVLIAHW